MGCPQSTLTRTHTQTCVTMCSVVCTVSVWCHCTVYSDLTRFTRETIYKSISSHCQCFVFVRWSIYVVAFVPLSPVRRSTFRRRCDFWTKFIFLSCWCSTDGKLNMNYSNGMNIFAAAAHIRSAPCFSTFIIYSFHSVSCFVLLLRLLCPLRTPFSSSSSVTVEL